MSWEANDIALIITTATTAVSAIFGLVLPIWRAEKERKDREKEELYKEFRTAVLYCVQHASEVAEYKNNLGIQFAYTQAGRTAGSLNDKLEPVYKDFQKSLALVEVLASEKEIDVTEFSLAASRLLATTVEFSLISGALVGAVENNEKQESQAKQISQMKKLGSSLLKAFRQT